MACKAANPRPRRRLTWGVADRSTGTMLHRCHKMKEADTFVEQFCRDNPNFPLSRLDVRFRMRGFQMR